MTETRNHTEEKNQSYRVRDQLEDQLGVARHTLTNTRRTPYRVFVTFKHLPSDQLFELWTISNAGFRGLEGYFLDADGETAFVGMSLGAIDRTWITDQDGEEI